MAYIGLFDILGFKQAILDKPLDDLKRVLGNEFSEVLNVCVSFNPTDTPVSKKLESRSFLKKHIEASRKQCSFIRISDTILLYSEETDVELGHIILAANKLIAFMILRGMPVRGAITRGDLFVDEEHSLVIGEGLVRACELEQLQQWSGGIIDSQRIAIPNVIDEERRIVDVFSILLEERAIFRYKAPCKSPNPSEGPIWCLGWPSSLRTMPKKHLQECLFKDNPLTDHATDKLLTVDAKDKMNNTIKFFQAFRRWAQSPLGFTVSAGLHMRINDDK